MSAEPEDVKPDAEKESKPKLTINIAHEHNSVAVKVKANTPFKKVFEAAEQRFGKDPGTFRFFLADQRIRPTDTPASLDMEDGDQIDAFIEQQGGGTGWR